MIEREVQDAARIDMLVPDQAHDDLSYHRRFANPSRSMDEQRTARIMKNTLLDAAKNIPAE